MRSFSKLFLPFSQHPVAQLDKMCIIFLAPHCPSNYAGGKLKLFTSLESKLEVGLCVDPTSYSPFHCKKLEVRHKGDWYDKCKWCTDLARQWREGKENDCTELDRAEEERLERIKSLELEIVTREEDLAKKSRSRANKENVAPPSSMWTACA